MNISDLSPEEFSGAKKITGSLDLSGLTSIPAGFNPTVGGYLDLSGLTASKTAPVYPLRWPKHMLADGILVEVIGERGNVWRVRVVGKRDLSYVVSDGKNFAHGATLKEAKADLVYKVTDRKPEQYAGMKLTAKITFAEAIACYRCITGACAFGVKNFVETTGAKPVDVTIREIIKKTQGHYGHERFKAFFAKKPKSASAP